MRQNLAKQEMAISLTDQYMALLSEQTRTSMQDYAHYLLMQRSTMTKEDAAEAWIEAVVQRLLEQGFLRAIETIKNEKGPTIWARKDK